MGEEPRRIEKWRYGREEGMDDNSAILPDMD
jgi:hypothetical protein